MSVEKLHENTHNIRTRDKREQGGKMNDNLFRTILKRYEAEIEDANYKIECICEHNMVIPEHIDITGEVDKQLERIAAAEDKLAAMRKYYGGKKAGTVL
jgi:hypothetical protein